MSLADELDAPIVFDAGGQTVRLGVLTLADLGEIEREYQEEQRREAMATLPNTATAAQIQAAQRAVSRLTFEGLAGHVFTLTGIGHFLRRELVKGGSAADFAEADRLIPKLARIKGWRELGYLAAQASGLYPPEPAQPTDGEAPDPNRQAGPASPAT